MGTYLTHSMKATASTACYVGSKKKKCEKRAQVFYILSLPSFLPSLPPHLPAYTSAPTQLLSLSTFIAGRKRRKRPLTHL